MLPIVYRKQEKPHWCGPAVIQMIGEYWGTHLDQATLAVMLKTRELHGTHEEDMERVAEELGYEILPNKSTLEDTRRFLDQKIPVIVAFIEPIHDEGHYSIIVDATDDEITLYDPESSTEPTIVMTLEEFLDRWHSKYTDKKHWMLAVRPKTA